MKSLKKRMHIISRGDKWIVKNERLDQVIHTRDSKDEAIDIARNYKELGYDIIIHKKDGSVESWEKTEFLRKCL